MAGADPDSIIFKVVAIRTIGLGQGLAIVLFFGLSRFANAFNPDSTLLRASIRPLKSLISIFIF